VNLADLNGQFWNYKRQEYEKISEPNYMNFEKASELVAQTTLAQLKLKQYYKAGMTPFAAMLEVTQNGNR
jgi:hypothetical protein